MAVPLKISVVVPTLNCAGVLGECLSSVRNQAYPAANLELIVADGGSTDGTLEIARRFADKVVPNPLKTGEAGKAAGAAASAGDLLAFVDSDNILPDKGWLTQMTRPFDDPHVVASEPLLFAYRRGDGLITRYAALIGMNDPICLFLGNYDRYSYLTGRWTDLELSVRERETYLQVQIEPGGPLPTMGANGFIIRRSALESVWRGGDYLFDIDVLAQLAAAQSLRVAKVKTTIVHLFCGHWRQFANKQKRRIGDYLFYRRIGARHYNWNLNRAGLIKFVLSTLFVLPVLAQALKGYRRHPDIAWFFHPAACWITLWAYGTGRLRSFFGSTPYSRERWGYG